MDFKDYELSFLPQILKDPRLTILLYVDHDPYYQISKLLIEHYLESPPGHFSTRDGQCSGQGFVWSIVRQGENYETWKDLEGLEPWDLFQIGYEALMEAGRNFKPSKGFELTTFAHHRVQGAIQREMNGEMLPEGITKKSASHREDHGGGTRRIWEDQSVSKTVVQEGNTETNSLTDDSAIGAGRLTKGNQKVSDGRFELAFDKLEPLEEKVTSLYSEGYSTRDIAEKLRRDISRKTVDRRLHKAERKLKRELSDLIHETPQVSRFKCNCSQIGKYEYIGFGENFTCSYCGRDLEVSEIIHEERKNWI